jgi:hypothetical protein
MILKKKNPINNELIRQIIIHKEHCLPQYICYYAKLGNLQIGRAVYDVNGKFVEIVDVIKDFQRQGVATILYDYIEKDRGHKLKKSPSPLPSGKLFWAKRNARRGDSLPPIRKNPFIGKPSKQKPNYEWVTKIFEKTNTPYIFISRSEMSDVYYIKIDKNKIIFSATTDLTPIPLIKGEYIYKVYYNSFEISPLSQKRLITLSNLDLIPKIEYIDKKVIISKYIEAIDLETLSSLNNFTQNEKEKLFKAIEKELKKWHDHGIIHGDLALRNILVTNEKVYLIDPSENKNSDLMFNFMWDKESLNKIKKTWNL